MTKKEKEALEQTKRNLEIWWEKAESERSNQDYRWFQYDLWVNGYHYAKWDRNTQQITTTIRDKGKPKVTINMIYVTLRAVRNFVLRNRPRAEATPLNLTPENLDDVIKINKYLDYVHEKLRLRMKLKATVWHALKYSVGYWQVLWDADKKEIDVSVVDPYDLYWDPMATCPEDARYVFLAIQKPIESIINDPKYRDYIKKEGIELVGSDRQAASTMKERLMQVEKTGTQIQGNNKKDTAILKECWFKEWDEEQQVYNIKIAAFADKVMIRPPEDAEVDRLPFFRLQSDVNPLKMFGQGWVKNLIPVNKLLNRLESQVAEYNDLMNRGKWVSDKGAGVRVINNENGQIIEKKRGFEVRQEPIASLSAAIFRQIENVNRYIEDLGGKHDASLGRMPTGAKSGKALEALQVGDSNNMSEVVENVEEFLEDVYEYILKLAAKKYQFARLIIPISQTGEREFIKLIGESADNQPEDATVIPKENSVDVKITSWLAETAEARREVLRELYELQAIDQETLLRGYELGNVAEVLKQSRIEKEMQRQAETEQQLLLADAQNQNNQQPQATPAGSLQANAAIQALLSGQEPQVPQDAGPEFLAYVDQFISSPEFGSLPPEAQQLLQGFRQQVAMSIR